MKRFLLSTIICLSVACGGPTPTVGINSSCPYNVVRHDPNGWLITEPEVHFDFWGDWSSHSSVPSTEFYTWAYLLYEDGVLSRLSEYGVHEGVIDIYIHTDQGSSTYLNDGGISATSDGGTAVLDDSSFATTINWEIDQGFLPYPNDNSIYVILLPSGVTTQKMIDHSWYGYHTHATYGSQRYAYAIVNFQDSHHLDINISHEIAEAATNPGGYGYWDSASGDEIGDMCESNTDSIGGTSVQKLWSQALCQCQ